METTNICIFQRMQQELIKLKKKAKEIWVSSSEPPRGFQLNVEGRGGGLNEAACLHVLH